MCKVHRFRPASWQIDNGFSVPRSIAKVGQPLMESSAEIGSYAWLHSC
jgi:hypothetical protein